MDDTPALTDDGFLGGRLSILQPAKGYRAGIDPVLLAAAVPARAGQSVLDLGCGVGVAALCLHARVSGLRVSGLELQTRYAQLARDNARRNGFPMQVTTGSIADMPGALLEQTFDNVIANPPYFRAGGGAPDAGRALSRGETVPLAVWIDAAVRRLRPGGTLCVIQAAERVPDLLGACDSRLGDLRLLPLVSREGRAADRVILRARKGRKGAFRLLPPLILHEGGLHLCDGESYRPEIVRVLRKGAPLPLDWGDIVGN